MAVNIQQHIQLGQPGGFVPQLLLLGKGLPHLGLGGGLLLIEVVQLIFHRLQPLGHLGQGVVVPYRDVLALFDLDNTSASHLTRRFLERAEQAGQVVNVAEDLPKSFVLCRPAGGEATVYLSQLSTATLLRRAENNRFE